MSKDNETRAMTMKSRPNEYTTDTFARPSILQPADESGSNNSHTSQEVNNHTVSHTMNSSRHNDTNSVEVNNGFPRLPNRKPSSETFVKKMNNYNNSFHNPAENTDGQLCKNLPEAHRPKARFEKTASDYIPEAQMKMLSSRDYDNDGYLTPIDPPPYCGTESSQDFSSTDYPSSPTGSETSTNSFQKRGKLRVDSGLGDCEYGRGSGSVRFSTSPSCSSNSMHNPRLSTQYEQHYEDIDQYHKSHQQQQQQQPKNTQQFGVNESHPHSEDLRQPQHMNVTGVTLSATSDTEDIDHPLNTSIAEAVLEPMHDPRGGSMPHTYTPLSIKRHSQTSRISAGAQEGRCWHIIIAIVIVLVISVTALGLSIYAIVTKSESSIVSHQGTTMTSFDIDQILGKLQQQVDTLTKENEAMRDVLLMQQNNLTVYVEDEVKQLASKQNAFSYLLQSVESKFEAQIANISLRPGPRGSPGVANFSSCITQSIGRSGPASVKESLETSYLPSKNEKQDYYVIFAYCTYKGATDANLDAQPDLVNNRHMYRCSCWGKVPENNQTTLCTIHVLMCPREG